MPRVSSQAKFHNMSFEPRLARHFFQEAGLLESQVKPHIVGSKTLADDNSLTSPGTLSVLTVCRILENRHGREIP